MTGRVVSTKLKNTTTVLVERTAKHKLYQKTFIRSKKYLADDAIGVKDGDIVEIIKTKPISKNKHWKVIKILGKSLAEIVEQQMKEKAEQVIAEVMPEDRPSVVGGQLSDSGQSIVSKSVTDKQKTEKPKSENRPAEGSLKNKQKTDNRRSKK